MSHDYWSWLNSEYWTKVVIILQIIKMDGKVLEVLPL